jgi:hypothetical protein
MIFQYTGLISEAKWANLPREPRAPGAGEASRTEVQMTHAQTFIANDPAPAGSRKRSHRGLLVAGALLAVLLIAELAAVLYASPVLDPLAPFYVT